MKIFLTGGDGLLGSNLVRELLKRGHAVTVLKQPGRSTQTLDQLELDIKEGDLLDADLIRQLMKGCDAVIHTAASTRIWPLRDEMIKRVNVEGTKNMLKAACANNIKKFIHVGTANTFSFGTKVAPGREGTPYKGLKYKMDYMDSKYQAHQLVLSYKDRLDVSIVNPTFMIGPYDSAPSSGAMVIAIYQRKLPVCAPGGRNYICVKDAAIGITNALTLSKRGESYILGHQNLSYKEMFSIIGRVVGKKPPSLVLPKWMVLLYGGWGSFMARLTGKIPTVSLAVAQISCDEHYFTAEKAVQQLKLPQTPIEEGVKECLDWLLENQYIPPT